MARLVPFIRVVKFGSRGKDVIAIKRALKAAGFGKGIALIPFFGLAARRNLRNFQRHHRLPVTGVYNRATHRTLMRYYDKYGAWILSTLLPKAKPKQTKQGIIVATALLGVAHRDEIHYTMGSSRMSGIKGKIKPPDIPPYEDCSSFATWCYWVAGAPDPNGLNYNGYGYTGTQIQHGEQISLPRLKPGDLVFYGNKGGIPTHVAIFVGNGKVVSNGSEGGPYLCQTNYRNDINQCRRYI